MKLLGEDYAGTLDSTAVDFVCHCRMKSIHGGNRNIVTVMDDDKCLVHGLTDGCSRSITFDQFPDQQTVRDEYGQTRILEFAHRVRGIGAADITKVKANSSSYSLRAAFGIGHGLTCYSD